MQHDEKRGQSRSVRRAEHSNGFEAAHYRCNARMRELESQFEAKASEIRAAFLSECASIMAE
jgi:hypothetical protein